MDGDERVGGVRGNASAATTVRPELVEGRVRSTCFDKHVLSGAEGLSTNGSNLLQ